MSTTPPLDLVLLWHMHQPDYRDPADGRFLMPWVYLHAIKDYADMAAHVERHPGIRAVFNFVPVLLEQIDDYVRQIDAGDVRDPLLRLLQVEDLGGIGAEDRALIVDSCFHHNHETMLRPYPQYRRLWEIFRIVDADPSAYAYLSADYLSDLLAWYHLVWIGEADRRTNPLFTRLAARGAGFSADDRRALYAAIADILRGVQARYRALARAGRIELSTTPRTHPIAPLLLDFSAAREAQPSSSLPRADAYPGGAARVRWQLRGAIDDHATRFGAAPAGLWPSEGAVSASFVAQAQAAGLGWIASSESVLANSLGETARQTPRASWLYAPWRLASAPGAAMMFRDERLSDLIGFEYAKWHGRDAAGHLVGELEAIARAAAPGATPVVLIALDGENAWEYYPYNGYYFFEELYGQLERHPSIRTRTLAEVMADPGRPPRTLARLVAGSWVSGTLSTWIGEPAKDRAWDLLCDAKRAFDEVLAAGGVDDSRRQALERQLGTCEGSDWFWWLGPYNPSHAVERFDLLYRHNLRRLYEMLGRAAPAALDVPLARGGGHPEVGGAMRRASPAP